MVGLITVLLSLSTILLFNGSVVVVSGGEIVNVTDDNWDELIVSRGDDLGAVFLVSNSWEWASNFFDWDEYRNLFDNDNNNRLVGFVNCRNASQLCREMGIYTDPTIRLGRPDSLFAFKGNERSAAKTFKPLLDDIMDTDDHIKKNEVFSPSSLDISAGPSLAEISSHRNRTVLARYCFSRSGACRRAQPDWERLAVEYQDSASVLVAEVNCSIFNSYDTGEEASDHNGPSLHKEHGRSCSWMGTWILGVKYARDGYIGEMKQQFHQPFDGRNATLEPLFQYDDLKSLAEELDVAAGSVNPIPLTDSTWNGSIAAAEDGGNDKNALILFTNPRCCLTVRDSPYGSNESMGCFDDSDEYGYWNWQQNFPVDCQQVQVDMVRLANLYPKNLIATVNCGQEIELCERFSASNLPRVMYGTIPNLNFSYPNVYPYPGITLDFSRYEKVSLIDLAKRFMGEPVKGPMEEEGGLEEMTHVNMGEPGEGPMEEGGLEEMTHVNMGEPVKGTMEENGELEDEEHGGGGISLWIVLLTSAMVILTCAAATAVARRRAIRKSARDEDHKKTKEDERSDSLDPSSAETGEGSSDVLSSNDGME